MPTKTKNEIRSDAFVLARLETKEDFCEACSEFDCSHKDLNEFFRDDAFDHKSELLAETYYFQPIKATEENLFIPVAFISFLNDYISLTKEEKKSTKISFWKQLKESVPHKLRGYNSYPAVKIGRLGVSKKYHRTHIGTHLLNLSKEYFLLYNKTGCRFITVDADNNHRAINFYAKNGFQFLWEQDCSEDTRTMYFDLKRYRDEQHFIVSPNHLS